MGYIRTHGYVKAHCTICGGMTLWMHNMCVPCTIRKEEPKRSIRRFWPKG